MRDSMKKNASLPALVLTPRLNFGLIFGHQIEQKLCSVDVRIVEITDDLFEFLLDDLLREPRRFIGHLALAAVGNCARVTKFTQRSVLLLVDGSLDQKPEIAGHIRRFTSSDELGQLGKVQLLKAGNGSRP